jgi:hypothetical protein
VSLSALCSPRSVSDAMYALSNARRSLLPAMPGSREEKMPHTRLVTRSTVISYTMRDPPLGDQTTEKSFVPNENS